MRKAALILSTVLVISAPQFASAGPNEEAASAIDQWVAALNSNDVERIVATYVPDATVHGTVSRREIQALSSSPTPSDMTRWEDLSNHEKNDLRQLGKGEAYAVPTRLIRRLAALGLADPSSNPEGLIDEMAR